MNSKKKHTGRIGEASSVLCYYRKMYWGDAGAGVLALADNTGRFLISYRSWRVMEPHTYGVVGGRVDLGEGPVDAAFREFYEETCYEPVDMELIPLYVYRDGVFRYHNFLGLLPNEFAPCFNWETDQWLWLDFDELLMIEPKHYGLRELLEDKKSLEIIASFL